MSGEDDDVTREIHTILSCYMQGRLADTVIIALDTVMEDEKDGPELVRLMQKWMACR